MFSRNSVLSARLAAITVAGALLLTGCTAPGAAPTASDGPRTTTKAGLTVADAWVKAADSGMSAAFGVLTNPTDADVTVVSATTAASSRVELHETVMSDGKMVMRPVKGGFVVPAHGSLKLAPGGNHIMLMGLAKPIAAGENVTFTLTLADGATVPFTAPAKDFAGANENYVGSATPTPTR